MPIDASIEALYPIESLLNTFRNASLTSFVGFPDKRVINRNAPPPNTSTATPTIKPISLPERLIGWRDWRNIFLALGGVVR